jgi:hypothetical protein
MNAMNFSRDINSGEKLAMGMFELNADELALVSGGDVMEDLTSGAAAVGGGMSAVGGGIAMEAGVAAGLVIGGGALAIAGGVGLIAYGAYQALHGK